MIFISKLSNSRVTGMCHRPQLILLKTWFYLCICVFLWAHLYCGAYMSEHNLGKLVFSCYRWALEDIRNVGVDGERLHSLNHLAGFSVSVPPGQAVVERSNRTLYKDMLNK